ncbi:glyoxal reductase [[Bacillus] enclensis]|uniref:Aldo/keto reductase n=1 Tax=[Bacillus] enclensis TaxID=1402860 RepID=A0A0V8HI11_9BACI|nr:aldo/keto reductase [[Bacillus] enclensis]KSU62050.1 glyoxal reductase [[Bacillus] enclensis]OAT83007.1 glyoxal reductase [Bacillus sp. MKU004]SCB98463.1 Aldo/keto reductase [[Bacillus] enclensis]
MLKNLQSKKTLHNGIGIPYVGLGVYQMKDPSETVQAVKSAIETGYLSVDTAAVYGNEESVGQGVKESGADRKDLFITSKVWNSDQGYDTTLKAFETSLKKLEMDYMDLYLIHWPVEGKYKDTWKALERLYSEGLVKSIGVSNFHQHHLEDLMSSSNEKPVINQIECHPRLSQEKLKAFCQEENIAVEAWSPIAQGRVLDEPALKQIAEKHGKSSAQVILRWHLQNDVVIIPKSVHANRIKENADLFNFELSSDEMNKINDLNQNERFGPDPDNFDF